MKILTKYKYTIGLSLFILLFVVINVLTLTNFPFVHSDESWLSGLTRSMFLHGDLGITESFFNLYPRQPHAIKSIFHLLQMPLMIIGGYNITSFRLLSLIIGVITIPFLYGLLKKLLKGEYLSLVLTILFSLNIHFIYTAHIARQEIMLLCLFVICLYLFYRDGKYKTHCIALIIGLSIGIHPNSFLLALMMGSLYLLEVIRKKISFKTLLILIGLVTIFACIFLGLSFLMNPSFITDYLTYGSTLGVTNGPLNKILGIFTYYYKLFAGVSGTYYVPPISFELLIYGLLCILHLYKALIKKDHGSQSILILVLALQIGFILIGRYNATYVIFNLPLGIIMLGYLLKDMRKLLPSKLIIGICLLLITSSAVKDTMVIKNEMKAQTSYDNYLKSIATYVKPDDRVLANLNCEYYFQEGCLIDFRNLAYLQEKSFGEYITDMDIDFIIYPEEMDYIYRNPNWQVLYGPMDYYDEMQSFLMNDCTEIGSFTDPTYGNRIVKYMKDYDWKVTIYKVNKVNNE